MSLSEEENLALAAKLEAKRKSDAAIEAFLANGGTITQIPAGKSGIVPGSGSMWGRGRKKTPEVPVIEPLEDDGGGDDLGELGELEAELADIELDLDLEDLESGPPVDLDSDPMLDSEP